MNKKQGVRGNEGKSIMMINKLMATFTLALNLLFACVSYNAYANGNCNELIENFLSLSRVNKTLSISEKLLFLRRLSRGIEENRNGFKEVLLRLENSSAADYEIDQAIKTLEGVGTKEISNLYQIENAINVAVYGSTNIPLYTLVMHAIIPSTVAKNV